MAEPAFPLAALAEAGRVAAPAGAVPAVTLAEFRPAGLVQVEAWPATDAEVRATLQQVAGIAPAGRPGRAVSLDGASVLTLSFGRYLAVGAGAGAGLAGRLESAIPADRGSVIDLGHARAAVRLGGPGATDVLRKGPAIDLDIRRFPVGAVAQTAIHHLGLVIHRRAADKFDLFVFRGYAQSFWDWLTDAAYEFGYEVGTPVG